MSFFDEEIHLAPHGVAFIEKNRPVLIGDAGFQAFQRVRIDPGDGDGLLGQALPAGLIGGKGEAGVFPEVKGQPGAFKAAQGVHFRKQGDGGSILSQTVVFRFHQQGGEGGDGMGDF